LGNSARAPVCYLGESESLNNIEYGSSEELTQGARIKKDKPGLVVLESVRHGSLVGSLFFLRFTREQRLDMDHFILQPAQGGCTVECLFFILKFY